MFVAPLCAQQFELADDPITSTLSDSRSVNFFDLNNDDWEDIYISNGLNGGQPDLLYLNNGDGTFTEITEMEIVEASNPSDGASFADFNNDGHIDGVVSSWYGAEDLLYLNDGSGALTYNANAGIVSGSFAETAAFGDFDNDGWLDLYITNSGGDKKNFLYRNLQDGTFEQITDHILVNDAKLSRGAIWGDFNDDQHLDLFVANESNAKNDLFLGQGDGVFEKYTSGNIVNALKSSMTGSWGDIDNDGDQDLFVGNSAYFSPQQNQLFINQGDSFEEVIDGPLVTTNNCTFGSAFGDYDNDGDLDLIVANGFCASGLANTLYENQGDGTFIDASDELSENNNYCTFGLAWGDVNNDGFLDLMIANCKNNSSDTQKANTLLINQGNENNWLKVKLTGIQSNTNAIGAKVKVKAMINGVVVWQVREVSAQSGYAGQNSMIVHFGLGNATQVDSMIIQWPAGGTNHFSELTTNQLLLVDEGMSTGLVDNTFSELLWFTVFPNPIDSKVAAFRIKTQSERSFPEIYISLFDSLGQLVWTEMSEVPTGESSLDFKINKKPAPGIYQILLQVEERTIAQTVIFY